MSEFIALSKSSSSRASVETLKDKIARKMDCLPHFLSKAIILLIKLRVMLLHFVNNSEIRQDPFQLVILL